VTVIVA